MTTYTGVADANGDFTVHFSSNYTGGQKVTVTAEKDSAAKTIELFAPSDVIGIDAPIQFSGTPSNFINDIGVVTVTLSGALPASFFSAITAGTLWRKATGLILGNGITSMGQACFYQWAAMKTLVLSNSLTAIDQQMFTNCTALEKVAIPATVSSIGNSAFYNCTSLQELTMLRATPPTILANSFGNMPASCVIKVPAASLAAYKSATNWSAYASQMIGV